MTQVYRLHDLSKGTVSHCVSRRDYGNMKMYVMHICICSNFMYMNFINWKISWGFITCFAQCLPRCFNQIKISQTQKHMFIFRYCTTLKYIRHTYCVFEEKFGVCNVFPKWCEGSQVVIHNEADIKWVVKKMHIHAKICQKYIFIANQ